MRKQLLIFAALIVIVSVLAGCTSSETTTPTTTSPTTTATSTTPSETASGPKSGGTLIEISTAVPSEVGWPADLVGANGETPQVCFDSFLRGYSDGSVVPWLAESYEMADDYSYIVFKLRENIDFHDGSHLDAEVAKWNLDNQIDAGREPYWESVEVLDDYTVRINFSEWRNTMFRDFVDGVSTWMCSKAAYDEHGEEWMYENAVGTGPFKFVSFARDESFVAVKNENWWNKASGMPYVDRYEILFVAEPTTQLANMQTGAADYIGMEPGKMTSDLAAIGMTIEASVVSIFALVPDTANPDSIWANQAFREAVEYAIDREAIAERIGYGYLQAPNQMPPRDNPHYNPDYAGRPYDPDKARQILDEAGIPEGTKVTIIVTPLAPSDDAVLAVQAYLREVGIEVELEFPQWSKYVTNLRGTWEDAALFQVFPAIGGNNYNATLVYYLHPTSGMLQSWEKTDEFVALLDESALAPEADPQLIRSVLDYIQDSVLLIPVHEAGRSWAYQSYVEGGEFLDRSMSSWKSVDTIWLNK